MLSYQETEYKTAEAFLHLLWEPSCMECTPQGTPLNPMLPSNRYLLKTALHHDLYKVYDKG